MHDWCHPILHALTRRSRPCDVFFRDDDAGWADEHLFALLDRFATHAIPIDLAVIPAALTPSLSQALLERMAVAGRGSIGVHQHGFAHVNHETEGRKCEFGSRRGQREQRREIEAGHGILTAAFGSRADRIFTPPWNRCTDDTARALVELGFAALSRDLTATPFAQPALTEIPVAVDWCKLRRRSAAPDALPQHIAACLAEAPQCGIMLHHAVLDRTDLDLLDRLLPLLRHHPMARCIAMAERLPGAASPRSPALSAPRADATGTC